MRKMSIDKATRIFLQECKGLNFIRPTFTEHCKDEILRRTRLELIRDILRLCQKGATKTQIVYRVNLNFKLADELLAKLLKAGYIALEKVLNRSRFVTTPKGVSFLWEMEKLDGILSELHIMEEPVLSPR